MIAMDISFVKELISEQQESVKKKYLPKGEPNEIKNFKEETVIVWYFEDEKRLYVLNSKFVTIFIKNDVLAVLDVYNISISIIDFINIITNLPKSII